jgi:hypothetical protein
MTRPLARVGIDELEALAAPPGISTKDLKSIAYELGHRPTLCATILLDKINLKLRAPGTSAIADRRDLAGTPTPTQNGFEFDVPIIARAELPKRPPKPALSTVATRPVPLALPDFTEVVALAPETATLAMSVEQAYRTLKATSVSTWDAIEFARRQVVARAQPDRVAKLEPARRKALLAEAREANIAYKVLLQARCSGDL